MEPATIAGVVAAEQAVSTTLEVGVPAAYGLLFLSKFDSRVLFPLTLKLS